MKVFSLTFHFSVFMSRLFSGHPVNNIFQAHFFSTFIVLANHNNADKIVCILLPDGQFYFNFIHPLQVFLNL